MELTEKQRALLANALSTHREEIEKDIARGGLGSRAVVCLRAVVTETEALSDLLEGADAIRLVREAVAA